MHIFEQYYGVRQYFIEYRFVSERKRQVIIEETRFLSTVFLCKEFKLDNIYSGVNFGGKIVAGTYFCGSLKKTQRSQKLEPEKIWCHTVDHFQVTYLCKRALVRSF